MAIDCAHDDEVLGQCTLGYCKDAYGTSDDNRLQ
jgi:hypothetical protein